MADLLNYWDIYEYSRHTQEMYYDVLFALLKKQQSIELRQTYFNVINAKSDDERHNARMN